MSDIRVIVPEELKSSVRSILEAQDMTISQAVRLFFREVVEHQGLPFAAQRGVPNAQTLAAMQSSFDEKNVITHNSVDDMFAQWDEEK